MAANDAGCTSLAVTRVRHYMSGLHSADLLRYMHDRSYLRQSHHLRNDVRGGRYLVPHEHV